MISQVLWSTETGVNGLAASRLEAIALTEEDKDGTIRYIEGLQELWDQAFVAAVEGDSLTDADRLEKVNSAEGVKFSLRQIDGMTEKRYNKYSWAVMNDVLTRQEQARFLSMFETYGVKGKEKLLTATTL